MKSFQEYKKTGRRFSCLFLLMFLVILNSCNPTKYVPSGKTLLDKNEINLNKDYTKKSSLIPYIKQKPNERIFGTRFYLWLYNLSDTSKTRWPHSWLRTIGEEPVIFDRNEATRSVSQIKSYVTSKGFFDGRVSDSIKTTDSRTSVYYNLNLKPAYTIRNLYYEITDTLIRQYFNFDSVNCLIKRGKPYDVDVLQAERARFEKFIRNQGYYAFSSEYITFEVDSALGNRQVNLYYNIRSNVTTDVFNRTTILPHQIYQVRNVYIYPDYNPATALQEGEAYLSTLDTVQYNGYYFITSAQNPAIRYDLILQTLYLKPGSVYNLTNTDQTQAHLMSLKVYRLVNINYNEIRDDADPTSLTRNLDCNIMLTLLTPQSYRVELEGTHSSGNIGGAVNLVYQHKNLFHGAELFSVTVGGSYEAVKQTDRLRSIREFGLETSLRLPQFLIPFLKSEDFIKKYNPSTNIVAAYNFQAMPLFTRTLASATFGYTWKSGRHVTHIVNPLLLNLVKLPPGSMDPVFAKRIQSTYLAYSYRDVLILGGGYSFIFNNQSIQNSRDYTFFRMNFESAGNMNSLVGRLSGKERRGDTTTYKLLGQPYAQYMRIDGDLRYNYSINEVSSVVYRAFLGVGIPYGNSKAIPFEKQYFAGGANSIRAWQVRTLGPGSYDAGNPDTTFLNQTADIKIELNAEYRFKLFWIMEGALFLDAGNIWTYNNDPARPGTKFSIKEKKTPEGIVIHRPFYNDIALGTGFGLRFDFKFVIGRLDLGMKLRDPRAGQGWILGNRPYTRRDFALVLGIGYPF